MKIISFFSRFTFICNLCFVVFVIFNRIETKKPEAAAPGAVIPFPFFKDLVIILGFSAIIINLLMCLAYLAVIVLKKTIPAPLWLTIANFIFLFVEFYFFFL